MIKLLSAPTNFLNRNTGFLILVAIIFFGLAILGFQRDSRRILNDTSVAVKNTEVIVSKQDETLDAIKNLAIDNRLSSDQKTNIIICMLQVPVSQRTTDTEQDCRSRAQASTPAPQNSLTTSQNSTSQTQNKNNNTNQGQGGNNNTPSPPDSPPQIPPRDSILPGEQPPVVACVDALGIGVCL